MEWDVWAIPFMYGESDKIGFSWLAKYKNIKVSVLKDQDLPWVKLSWRWKKKVYKHGYHSEQDEVWEIEINENEDEVELEPEDSEISEETSEEEEKEEPEEEKEDVHEEES